MPEQMNELGFYTLAGAPESPRDLIAEVAAAEEMGLGAAFISERLNIKEAATISGAVGAVSSKIGIATAVTNQNKRHPKVTAAYATTMHFLTNGRFALGLGRGTPRGSKSLGLKPITTAQMEDFAHLMRRLFRGETVFNHDGAAGSWPTIGRDSKFDEDIPLLLTSFGPNSLALGGRAYDAVVLHTFTTTQTDRPLLHRERGRSWRDIRGRGGLRRQRDRVLADAEIRHPRGRRHTLGVPPVRGVVLLH